MEKLVDLSKMLIELNNVDDKDSIIGLNNTQKIIVTKQTHNDINKNMRELGLPISKLETFQENVTSLRNRLIKLGITENYLTPRNIEKKIKNEIINYYQQDGLPVNNIQSTLVDVMVEFLQQNTDIEKKAIDLAIALDGKLKQQQLDFEKKKLLDKIHKQLTNISVKLKKYGAFHQLIEIEFSNYVNEGVKELNEISSALKKRNDLLEDQISNLEKTYDFLSTSIKQNITILEFHKNICDLINLGYSRIEAFNLIIDNLNIIENNKAIANKVSEDKFPENYVDVKDVIDTYEQAKLHIIKKDKREFANSDNSFNDAFLQGIQQCMSKIDFIKYIGFNKHTKKTDVSLSAIENAQQNCWLNASIKYIYSYHGIDTIKQSIKNQRDNINEPYNQEVNEQKLQLLAEFELLFDKMEKNEIIDIKQLTEFLSKIYMYGVILQKYKINNDEINKISQLIEPAIKEENGVLNLRLELIEQELPKEFFLAISVFLGLHDATKHITRKVFNKYTIQKKDLQNIGINIPHDVMEIEIKASVDTREMTHKIPGTGESNDQKDIKLEYIIDYLKRDGIKSNLSKYELNRIYNKLINLDKKNKIPCKLVDKEILYVDTEKCEDFSIDFLYFNTITYGESIKDIDKIKELFKNVYPKILLDIIDINTGEKYVVEGEPTVMVLHMGKKISSGHYLAISFSDNGEIIVHNDRFIFNIYDGYLREEDDKEKLEQFKQLNNVDKLIIIMDKYGAYPTDISFKVTDIKPKGEI